MWWSTWPWYEGHAAPGSVDDGRLLGDPRRPPRRQRLPADLRAGRQRVDARRRQRARDVDPGRRGAASTRDFAIGAGERLTLNIGDGVRIDRRAIQRDRREPRRDARAAHRRLRALSLRERRAVLRRRRRARGGRDRGRRSARRRSSSTTPAANATGVAVDANLTVTFSEPVNAAPGAFTLACPSGTPIALTNLTASPATDVHAAIAIRPADQQRAARCASMPRRSPTSTRVDPPDTIAADVTVPFTTSACAAITVTPSMMPVPGGTVTLPYGPVTFSADRRGRSGDLDHLHRRAAGRAESLARRACCPARRRRAGRSRSPCAPPRTAGCAGHAAGDA